MKISGSRHCPSQNGNGEQEFSSKREGKGIVGRGKSTRKGAGLGKDQPVNKAG